MRSAMRGFTLLEILLVVVLISILAGLSGTYLIRRFNKAKVRLAEVEIKGRLSQALWEFYTDNGVIHVLLGKFNPYLISSRNCIQCKISDVAFCWTCEITTRPFIPAVYLETLHFPSNACPGHLYLINSNRL